MVNGFINKVVMMRQPTNNRNSIASTLNTSPLWVKTPLVLPKLWQSYSVASYTPLPEEEGLREKVELPLERETEGFEKIPSLMGKSDASECNESSLSNCRVQLALSTRKDGMICMQSHFDNHVM